MQKEFSGQANIWFNTQMKTYFVTLENSKGDIPVGSHALVKITHENIENPIIFEAKIIKATERKIHNYFVKIIRIPLRYAHLIPRDLKNINYHLEIIPQA